ncbi:hypothetical protein [Acidimangrovimonas pyrenivorans]|uniref:DUF1772 domain-containing protein n=1 Tax=Acidimangrovimonas pyrenivorans TaxID=2030798 RepID=A0ABV7AK82_9RHOB
MTRARAAYAAFFAATAALYGAMVGWSLPRIAAAAGGRMPFDMRPAGYTYDDARALLAALDGVTTEFYLDVQQRLDLFYPGMLALALGIALWHLTRRWPLWLRLAGLALCAATAGFDWLENARVAEMLRGGAEALTPEMAAAASRATVVKSALGATAMTLVLALALIRLGQWLRARRKG